MIDMSTISESAPNAPSALSSKRPSMSRSPRAPNPNDYPTAKAEMLVPASVIFQKPKQRQSQRLLPMVDLCSGRQLAPS